MNAKTAITKIDIQTLAGKIPSGSKLIVIRKCERDNFIKAYGTSDLYDCHYDGWKGELTVRGSEIEFLTDEPTTDATGESGQAALAFLVLLAACVILLCVSYGSIELLVSQVSGQSLADILNIFPR